MLLIRDEAMRANTPNLLQVGFYRVDLINKTIVHDSWIINTHNNPLGNCATIP